MGGSTPLAHAQKVIKTARFELPGNISPKFNLQVPAEVISSRLEKYTETIIGDNQSDHFFYVPRLTAILR